MGLVFIQVDSPGCTTKAKGVRHACGLYIETTQPIYADCVTVLFNNSRIGTTYRFCSIVRHPFYIEWRAEIVAGNRGKEVSSICESKFEDIVFTYIHDIITAVQDHSNIALPVFRVVASIAGAVHVGVFLTGIGDDKAVVDGVIDTVAIAVGGDCCNTHCPPTSDDNADK